MKPKDQYFHLFYRDLDPGEFPLRVSIETTNHCNLSCAYCPRTDSGRGYGNVSRDLFLRIAEQTAGRDAVLSPQGFGEPFIHPQFGELLRAARGMGVRYLDVVTNATLLDDANCRALIEADVAIVTVDIDGADPAVFERNRTNARYDQVVGNVQRLFRMRDAMDAVHPHISLSAVQMADVVPSMPAFRALWEPFLRDDDDIFLAKPVTWAGDRPMAGSRAATADELRTRPPCRMLYKTLQIYFDGRTSPCTYDHACRLHVGDASVQSIEEIWHGAPLQRLRALHEAGRSGEIDLCRGCPDHHP